MGLPAELRAHVTKWAPELNKDLCEGLAYKHLAYADEWIHQAFQLVAARYPEGLKYEGIRPVSAQERYSVVTRRSGSDRTFDIAVSDFVLLAVQHSFHGVPLKTVYVAYPYTSIGSFLTISSARLFIKPVLCDRIFSVNDDTIFAKLKKIKMTFPRRVHYFQSNWKTNSTRQAEQVVWSHIFNSSTNRAKMSETSPKTTLVTYLFAKYGVTETFKRFTQTDVVVGVDKYRKEWIEKNDAELAQTLTVVDEENFPPADWVICSTTGIRLKRKKSNDTTGLKIAIPRNQYTPLVRGFVASMYYTLDHFPDHQIQYEFDNVRTWKLFLGYILRGDDQAISRLMNEMDTHVGSIETYLDPMLKVELKKLGYICEDFYEFLHLVLVNYEEWILEKDRKGNSPIGKVFSVLPYVLYDISAAINNVGFALSAPGVVHKAANIESIFQENIRYTLFYALIRQGHGEVEASHTPGDCFAKTHAKEICPQTDSSGSRAKRTTPNDTSSRLHANWVYNQLVVTSKRDPTGIRRINLNAHIDEQTCALIHNPTHEELVRWSQIYLENKI